MDPHSGVPEKNTSHGNKVLPQNTTHLVQTPFYKSRSLYQDPAGNRIPRRPHHRKETQTEVSWTVLLFIRPCQNPSRHSERGKKTRETEEEVGRQHQGIDGPEVHQVLDGSGEQRKMEETGCGIICGAPTTPVIKRWVKLARVSFYLFFLTYDELLNYNCHA